MPTFKERVDNHQPVKDIERVDIQDLQHNVRIVHIYKCVSPSEVQEGPGSLTDLHGLLVEVE